MPNIKIVKLDLEARIPTKATPVSACWDLYSVETAIVYPGEVRVVRTGLAMEVVPGFFIEIRPRSGLSGKGVIVVNSPGTIDSDYRGEVLVLLTKLVPGPHYIHVGDRIAQMRLVECTHMEKFIEVSELSETERGKSGFGSTGR